MPLFLENKFKQTFKTSELRKCTSDDLVACNNEKPRRKGRTVIQHWQEPSLAPMRYVSPLCPKTGMSTTTEYIDMRLPRTQAPVVHLCHYNIAYAFIHHYTLQSAFIHHQPCVMKQPRTSTNRRCQYENRGKGFLHILG